MPLAHNKFHKHRVPAQADTRYNAAMGIFHLRRRRFIIAAAVAAGLLVATVAVMCVGLPYLRHREVRNCLAAFNANPSQENATRLAEIIASGRADKDEITEILRAWLDLKVITEESYRPNAPICVTLKSGNQTQLICGPWPNDDDEPQPRPDSTRVIINMQNRQALYPQPMSSRVMPVPSQSVRFSPGLEMKLVFRNDILVGARPISATLSIADPGVYTPLVTIEGIPEIIRTHYEKDGTVIGHIERLREADTGIMDGMLIRLGLKKDRAPEMIFIRVEVPCEIHVEEGP
jgi:hypothetical protein